MSAGAPNAVTTPRSEDQLRQIAGQQVASEIGAQEAPLKQQQADLGARENYTISGIGNMFGELQPIVSGEADKVQSSYDQAFQAQQAIFNSAQQRLNDIKQSRAQEAQTLAQQMGGPVAVGEFTASALPQQEELAATAPNSLLHDLADAQAGEQEARSWSGKVFPLIRTEQEANARSFFESQIKDISSQISTLEGSKQGQVNSRLNDLLTSERQFQLNQNQLALDKLKSNRDWSATLRTLKNDDTRLKLASGQFGLQEAGVTGVYKGKPTLAAIKTSIAERQAAQRLNMTGAQLTERIRHNQETEAVQRQRVNNQTQANAMKIIDHAMNPSKASAITLTTKHWLDPSQIGAAISGRLKDSHRDPKTGKWYVYTKTTLTPQQAIAQGYNLGGNTPISDPQDLYNLLVGSGTPPAMALRLVRTRTGTSDFTPGGTTNYTPDTLGKMTNKELMGIAKGRGYKGSASRAALINFIQSRNPNANPAGDVAP